MQRELPHHMAGARVNNSFQQEPPYASGQSRMGKWDVCTVPKYPSGRVIYKETVVTSNGEIYPMTKAHVTRDGTDGCHGLRSFTFKHTKGMKGERWGKTYLAFGNHQRAGVATQISDKTDVGKKKKKTDVKMRNITEQWTFHVNRGSVHGDR